jgi:hypothetical protein
MESSGRIGIFNNPGTGYENFIAKDVISSGGIFSGPGTGLTGTALALNIGGSSRLIMVQLQVFRFKYSTKLLDLTLL